MTPLLRAYFSTIGLKPFVLLTSYHGNPQFPSFLNGLKRYFPPYFFSRDWNPHLGSKFIILQPRLRAPVDSPRGLRAGELARLWRTFRGSHHRWFAGRKSRYPRIHVTWTDLKDRGWNDGETQGFFRLHIIMKLLYLVVKQEASNKKLSTSSQITVGHSCRISNTHAGFFGLHNFNAYLSYHKNPGSWENFRHGPGRVFIQLSQCTIFIWRSVWVWAAQSKKIPLWLWCREELSQQQRATINAHLRKWTQKCNSHRWFQTFAL